MTNLATDYRTRIYNSYVNSRQRTLAPASLEELKPRLALLKKLIQDHFPQNRNAKILDLGCGHGALIYVARTLGYSNILGIDCSPEQVAEAARLKIEGVQQGDLFETLDSLGEETCDAIVTFDAIEHFKKEELIVFVDRVRRVLKTGGKWIIHTPNAESPFGNRILYCDFTHELAFTQESISQLLFASGFGQVNCFEDAPIPHGLKSTVRLFLWQAIRSVLKFYLAVETGHLKGEYIFSQNFLTVATK